MRPKDLNRFKFSPNCCGHAGRLAMGNKCNQNLGGHQNLIASMTTNPKLDGFGVLLEKVKAYLQSH